jgi:hypothetical protein
VLVSSKADMALPSNDKEKAYDAFCSIAVQGESMHCFQQQSYSATYDLACL